MTDTAPKPKPVVGMLIRPRHKQDGYRTILEVNWRTIPGDPDKAQQCQAKFLLYTDRSKNSGEPFMQTPWYPAELFWHYWALCDS